jgi:ABC-type transporter Mla subunit MlaD
MRRPSFAAVALSLLPLGVLSCEGPPQPAPYRVQFEDAAGVQPNAPVWVAGVAVGRVETVTLDEDRAQITFTLNRGVALSESDCAQIASRNVNGDKVLKLTHRTGGPPLAPGGELHCSETEGTQQISDRMAAILDTVLEGKGIVGRLLKDDSLAAKFERSLECQK